jgi:hypothetical protein
MSDQSADRSVETSLDAADTSVRATQAAWLLAKVNVYRLSARPTKSREKLRDVTLR